MIQIINFDNFMYTDSLGNDYIYILVLFLGWFSSVKASPDFQIIIEFEDIISRETILKNLTMIVEDIHETNPKEIIELLK